MIFFIIAFILFLIAAYPFVIYPLILACLPKTPLVNPVKGPVKGPVEGAEISFTLMFCAYNEELALPDKLANLRQLKTRHPGLEILVYSDMSTDRTLEMLQAQSDLLTVVSATRRSGKAWGMRELAAKATGDVLIFTDANVSIHEDAIDRLAYYFLDPTVGTVSGHLKYTNPNESETAEIGGLYWRLEERIKALESRTGSTMGADGALFAIRRALHSEVPLHVLDDLTISLIPLFDGYRVISAPDVIAYERLATDPVDEYRRKRRIACRAFNTHRFLSPKLRSMTRLDRFKYVSHKLIRWFSPFLLGLSALFGVLWLASLPGLAGWAGLCLVVGAGARLAWKRRNSRTVEILMAFVATGHGVVDSLLGKTYQIWEPPQSRNT